MGRVYNLGIIGIGMGINMLPVVESSIPMKVTALCSRRLEKLKAIQMAHPEVEYVTTDYRELCARGDLDIICVFSPDALHYDHCKAALMNGKHVFCTKPLVTDLENAKELCKLTEEKGVKFLVGQTMRYEPQFSAVKRMYDDGELGKPLFAEAHYVHDMRPVFDATPWRIEMPQDVMFGGTCHPVDVLRWFFGDVEEVHCLGVNGDLYESPKGTHYTNLNNFLLNLRFKTGVIARVLGAYGLIEPPMPMMGVKIFGTKGSANGEFSDFLGGKVEVVYDKYEIKSPFQALYPPEKQGAFGHGTTVLRYLEHFADCLENDKTPNPDIKEGAKSIAVCCAAYESIKSGKIEKVFNEF